VSVRPLGVRFSNLDSIVFEEDIQQFSREEILAVYDEELGGRFFARPEARILISLPGMGPILGA
jgi:hypothetical protein